MDAEMKINPPMSKPLARRELLKAGAALTVAPAFMIGSARAAQQVIVRSPGGALEEAFKAEACEPFTKATGIEVVMVPSTIAKMLAMFGTGNIELDVLDIELVALLSLMKQDVLANIEYDKWKHTDASTIDPMVRKPTYTGNYFFSSGIAYNTQSFAPGTHPQSWKELWDLQRFPGARTLPSMQSGMVALEFALLADGVPMDKLYPIDVDRAFRSLDKLRPSIRKYWDTGAASVQMLTEKEAAVGAFYSGRIQTAKDAGAPVAVEWNEQMLQAQVFAIPKAAKNVANAQKFIDFVLQPKIQAAYFSRYNYGPANLAAIKLMTPEVISKLPNSPEHMTKAFHLDAAWWDANRNAISSRWSRWLLRKA